VKDLREMQRLSVKLWPKFISPCIKGTISKTSTRELTASLQPYIKMMLRNLNHHDEELLDETNNGDGKITDESLDRLERNKLNDAADIPYYTKMLLIAAYLASYNPPKHDRVLFGSQRIMNKRNKRKEGLRKHGGATKNAGKKNKIPLSLQGPQSFGSERLLYLYRSLVVIKQGGGVKSVYCDKQIASLISLKLLVKVSRDGELDEVKYSCLADRAYMDAIGSKVQLKLDNYLYKSYSS